MESPSPEIADTKSEIGAGGASMTCILLLPPPFGCPIHGDGFIVGMGGNEDVRADPKKRLSS
jgi:hypothetical protein